MCSPAVPPKQLQQQLKELNAKLAAAQRELYHTRGVAEARAYGLAEEAQQRMLAEEQVELIQAECTSLRAVSVVGIPVQELAAAKEMPSSSPRAEIEALQRERDEGGAFSVSEMAAEAIFRWLQPRMPVRGVLAFHVTIEKAGR